MKDSEQFIRELKRKYKLNKPEMRGLVATFHNNLRDSKTREEAEKKTLEALKRHLEKKENEKSEIR
jgi:predicted RNase H-like HicB family nuclease